MIQAAWLVNWRKDTKYEQFIEFVEHEFQEICSKDLWLIQSSIIIKNSGGAQRHKNGKLRSFPSTSVFLFHNTRFFLQILSSEQNLEFGRRKESKNSCMKLYVGRDVSSISLLAFLSAMGNWFRLHSFTTVVLPISWIKLHFYFTGEFAD